MRYGYVFYVPAQSSVTASGNADIGTNCFVGDFDIKTQTYTQKAQLVSEKGGTYTAKLQSGWYVIYIANDYLPTIITKLNAAKIQLEIGTKATVYEPYREQFLTLPTPNGLPGIQVNFDGNWVDKNRQQWVSDVVDLAAGTKTQFDTFQIITGDSTILGIDSSLSQTTRFFVSLDAPGKGSYYKSLCSHAAHKLVWSMDEVGFYADPQNAVFRFPKSVIGETADSIKSWLTEQSEKGTPLKILHQLTTPITTPLTADEIAAYKTLTAYAPDTVVQASDGAGVKLEYQRDVNLVVKNLEDAIASMTTTT